MQLTQTGREESSTCVIHMVPKRINHLPFISSFFGPLSVTSSPLSIFIFYFIYISSCSHITLLHPFFFFSHFPSFLPTIDLHQSSVTCQRFPIPCASDLPEEYLNNTDSWALTPRHRCLCKASQVCLCLVCSQGWKQLLLPSVTVQQCPHCRSTIFKMHQNPRFGYFL